MCIQPPTIPCVYTDSVTKQEHCLIVLILYPGVKGLNVDLVVEDNGPEQTLVATYNWPASMYDVTSMFKDDATDTMIAIEGEPDVQAVEKALQQFRSNMEDAPIATVKVKLPVEVKSDPTTWKKSFNKKDDGGIIVFLTFERVRKEYVKMKSISELSKKANINHEFSCPNPLLFFEISRSFQYKHKAFECNKRRRRVCHHRSM